MPIKEELAGCSGNNSSAYCFKPNRMVDTFGMGGIFINVKVHLSNA